MNEWHLGHRAMCAGVFVGGCDCMGGFSYKTQLSSHTQCTRVSWKCHKTWFIVCLLSALFEFDNLNHSHFPHTPPPPFFFLSTAFMDYWNIKISGRRAPGAVSKCQVCTYSLVLLDRVKGFNYLCTYSLPLHERLCHPLAVYSWRLEGNQYTALP